MPDHGPWVFFERFHAFDRRERWRELASEHARLGALRAGLLTAADGVVVHRGREIRRSEFGRAIAQVEAELDAVKAKVLAHDRACRTLHRQLAARLGHAWQLYLEGLLALLHYAEHSAADLADATDHLHHVFAVASADRRISRNEAARIVASGHELHRVLGLILSQRGTLKLSKPVAERLGVASWADALSQQPLLPAPNANNLAQWLPAIESWVNGVSGALHSLASTAFSAYAKKLAIVHPASCH